MYILSVFFFSKCSLFHNSNISGSCIIHILYTGCAKIEKNNFGAKRLILNWDETRSKRQCPVTMSYCKFCFNFVTKEFYVWDLFTSLRNVLTFHLILFFIPSLLLFLFFFFLSFFLFLYSNFPSCSSKNKIFFFPNAGSENPFVHQLLQYKQL